MDTRLLEPAFGHTHSHVLARLGRFLPSPYVHFGSPMAPYSLAAHPAHPFDYGQAAAAAAAAMAGGHAYTIDGLLGMTAAGMQAPNGLGAQGPPQHPQDAHGHAKKGE